MKNKEFNHINRGLFIENLFSTRSYWPGKQKPPISEEEKAQYRSVILSQPRYCDLLKQEIKKNRILTLHLHQSRNDYLEGARKQLQRVYRVKRRKDIIKDDYSAAQNGFSGGLAIREIAKSFGLGVQHFRELELKLEQNYNSKVMENWMKILDRSHFQKVKTLTLKMASWYILEQYEGRFSILKLLFPNVENLKVIFTQMLGNKNIPIQDFTFRLIRRLHKLKSLRLEFIHCRFVKDEHLGVLSKTLRSRLDSLESLELMFEGLQDQISPRAIEELWKSLDTIPNLKRLELIGGFCWNKITKELFSTLCEVLQRKSDTLLALKIGFGSDELGKKDYEQLCKVLVHMLPRLQSLQLKFQTRESFRNDCLNLFGDLLSNGSNSLKTLSLEFRSQHGITSSGAKEFAGRIKNGSFPSMENLFIHFFSYFLHFDGLYEVAEAITVSFPNLKSLRFDSSGSTPTNREEMNEKATAILKERLKNLHENWQLGW